MKLLITGASGFIGRHAVKEFIDKGYTIVAQHRRSKLPEFLTSIKSDKLSFVQGDLTEVQIVNEMTKGVEGIIHIAGFALDWGPYKAFYKANVLATKYLLDAAVKFNMKIFTFISSAVVHGFSNLINASEKDGPYCKLISPYQKTKKDAEELVLKYSNNSLKVSIIRPTNVYGPDDYTWMYNMFDVAFKGLSGYIKGGKSLTSIVYISDLINSIILATEKNEAAGQIYNINSTEKITWKELANKITASIGIKEKQKNLPYFIAMIGAGFLTFIHTIFRVKKRPLLTRYLIHQATRNFHFSMAKAEEELGYQAKVMVDEGLKITAEAYLKLKKNKTE